MNLHPLKEEDLSGGKNLKKVLGSKGFVEGELTEGERGGDVFLFLPLG